MGRIDNLNNFVEDIAIAIRKQEKTTAAIKAEDFKERIEALKTGGGVGQVFGKATEPTQTELDTEKLIQCSGGFVPPDAKYAELRAQLNIGTDTSVNGFTSFDPMGDISDTAYYWTKTAAGIILQVPQANTTTMRWFNTKTGRGGTITGIPNNTYTSAIEGANGKVYWAQSTAAPRIVVINTSTPIPTLEQITGIASDKYQFCHFRNNKFYYGTTGAVLVFNTINNAITSITATMLLYGIPIADKQSPWAISETNQSVLASNGKIYFTSGGSSTLGIVNTTNDTFSQITANTPVNGRSYPFETQNGRIVWWGMGGGTVASVVNMSNDTHATITLPGQSASSNSGRKQCVEPSSGLIYCIEHQFSFSTGLTWYNTNTMTAGQINFNVNGITTSLSLGPANTLYCTSSAAARNGVIVVNTTNNTFATQALNSQPIVSSTYLSDIQCLVGLTTTNVIVMKTNFSYELIPIAQIFPGTTFSANASWPAMIKVDDRALLFGTPISQLRILKSGEFSVLPKGTKQYIAY